MFYPSETVLRTVGVQVAVQKTRCVQSRLKSSHGNCCPTPKLAGVSFSLAVTVYEGLSQADLRPTSPATQSNGVEAFDLDVVRLRWLHGAK